MLFGGVRVSGFPGFQRCVGQKLGEGVCVGRFMEGEVPLFVGCEFDFQFGVKG